MYLYNCASVPENHTQLEIMFEMFAFERWHSACTAYILYILLPFVNITEMNEHCTIIVNNCFQYIADMLLFLYPCMVSLSISLLLCMSLVAFSVFHLCVL